MNSGNEQQTSIIKT